MKKYAYLFTTLLLIFTTVLSFGQSVLITPSNTFSENTGGDNIYLRSNSHYLALQGIRYNGTMASKSPVVNGDNLLTIGAGGYYNSGELGYTNGSTGIKFKATQNWSNFANGTKISFSTTTNNTTEPFERMVIDNDGSVGIGTYSPTAKLQITDTTSGNTHLLLQSKVHTPGYSSSAIIKTSSTNETGGWENIFYTNEHPYLSMITWKHTSILSGPTFWIDGLGSAGFNGNVGVGGNVSMGGYAQLGTDAPKIKMKELTLTTSGVSEGEVSIAHGLTQSKIISVSVLVNAVSGNEIPPSYSSSKYPGYLYFFFVGLTHITIENSTGSYVAIAGRLAKILITYKE